MALIANGLDLGEGVTDDETIALRKTVIGGQSYTAVLTSVVMGRALANGL